MHFDVITGEKDHPKAIEFGKEWLKEVGEAEAYPSSTDKKFMKINQDEYVWIIYSGINKNFKAFSLESEIIIEEK
jgi:hypothetical protein